MKVAVFFGLAFLAAACASSLGTTKSNSSASAIQGRIFNGSKASLGQIPYIVSLLLCSASNSCVICGGSIIGRKWIVTAAHCILKDGKVSAYMGATTRSNAESVVTVPMTNAVVHPDWNGVDIINDIALIKIPEITYTSRVKNIKLPILTPIQTYANANALIAGWGGTYPGSPLPEDLLYANTKILSQEECAKKLTLIDSHICIASAPSNICGGDSGGPLVSTDTNTLIGITSFGVGSCDSQQYPGGFTRISSFLYWIQKITGIYYQ